MKKIQALLISIAMAAFFLTGNAFAAPDPSKTTNNSSDSLSQRYIAEFMDGNFMMHFIFHANIDGKPTSGDITIASLDGRSMHKMAYENQIVRFIINNGSDYIVNDNEKMAINIKLLGIDPSAFAAPEYKGADIIGSGTGTVMGKTLPYEEIAQPEEGSLRYYFEGTTLAYITGQDMEQDFVMEILELTKDVPADLFNIPSNYRVVNSYQDML